MVTLLHSLGGVPQATLAGDISAGATSLLLNDSTGWAISTPFVITLERGTAKEERIKVGGQSGTTLNTLTRGYDNTTAASHTAGTSCTIEHTTAGSNLDELNQLLKVTSAGDLLYYDGSAFQRLAKGSASQRLISGTTPAWSYFSLPRFASTSARDTEITAPSSGYGIYLDTGDTAEGPQFYNGTSWRLPWNMPWGFIATGAATSSQTGVSTVADVTSATVTFTAVTGRRYRIVGHCVVQQSTSTATSSVIIADGSNTQIQSWAMTLTASSFGTANLMVTVTPSAGSVTYKLRMSATAGTIGTSAAATAPATILVEDIGPSGNPT